MTPPLLAQLGTWAPYGCFLALVLFMLALDLGVFHRRAGEESLAKALGWTVAWIAMAGLFAVAVFFAYENHWLGLGLGVPQAGGGLADVSGATALEQFATGYLLEKSLSMDNVFIISVLFASFGVPAAWQHRTLFWGILGALLMRGAMIGAGAQLVHRFDWILVLFGAFLVFTAVKMGLAGEAAETDPSRNPAVRLARRCLPVSGDFDGPRFFTVQNGRRLATPLFLALVAVEFTDLVFALDSIPAVFGVTRDPFIVLTSNIFAILGLRALYFCLAAMVRLFRFLKQALVLILSFVGVKLMLQTGPAHAAELLGRLGAGNLAWRNVHLPDWLSLAVVGTLLGGAVAASLLTGPKTPGGPGDGT